MTDHQAVMDLERKLGNKRRAQLREWLASHIDHAHVIDKDTCRECDHAAAKGEQTKRGAAILERGQSAGYSAVMHRGLMLQDERRQIRRWLDGHLMCAHSISTVGRMADWTDQQRARIACDHAQAVAMNAERTAGVRALDEYRAKLGPALIRIAGRLAPDLRIWNVGRAWDVAHAEKSDRDANAAKRAAYRRMTEANRNAVNVAHQRVIDNLAYGPYAGISIEDAEALAYYAERQRWAARRRALLDT